MERTTNEPTNRASSRGERGYATLRQLTQEMCHSGSERAPLRDAAPIWFGFDVNSVRSVVLEVLRGRDVAWRGRASTLLRYVTRAGLRGVAWRSNPNSFSSWSFPIVTTKATVSVLCSPPTIPSTTEIARKAPIHYSSRSNVEATRANMNSIRVARDARELIYHVLHVDEGIVGMELGK